MPCFTLGLCTNLRAAVLAEGPLLPVVKHAQVTNPTPPCAPRGQVRYSHLLGLLLAGGHHVLVVGETGAAQ